MKQIIITIAAMLASLAACAQSFSLQQCIDTALANNNSIRKQSNYYEAQKLSYRQARQNLLPSVNASAGQSWIFGRSIGSDNVYRSANSAQTNFSLSANLLLFDGLKMKYSIDEAKAAMQASEANVESIKTKIIMNISAMYLQALLNKELVTVAEQQLTDTRLKISKDSALVAANRLAEGELYTLQAQAAKEELELTQAQNNKLLSLLDLAQALELNDFSHFDIQMPAESEFNSDILPDNDDVYAQAIANRPEIKAAQYSLSASEQALKSAKAGYYPTLSAGASVGTGYYNMYGSENNSFGQQMGDNLSTSIGLNLSIPIFNQMQVNNNVKRAKFNIANSQIEIDEAKKTLRKEIDQAYYNALAAKSREVAAEKAEKSNREAFRYAEQKYESGRSSVYEYYEAKLNYTRALSERLQAKYDYLFKLKVLEYYRGVNELGN